MAYVVPSGTIQLMRGIRLDNRYAHTIYFADATAQYNWFTNKVAYTYSNQYYTRHNSNSIKLKVNCDTVADCTYMRFQNRPNGKWYYAFINAVNYINENVTEIIFEIDVMQTWFFQTGHDIKPCFVDREHVNADSFGIYHAPDTPKTDMYTMHELGTSGYFDTYSLVMQFSSEPTDPWDNNSFSGTKTILGTEEKQENAQIFKTFLQQELGGSWDKNQQSANLVDMYAFPMAFSSHNVVDNVKTMTSGHPQKFTYGAVEYTPKNKKLLTSPYCYLVVSDGIGDANTYQWELFNNAASIVMVLRGNPLGGGSITIYPQNYAGLTNNYDAGILMNNFPKRSFSYDAYSAWIAAGGQTKLSDQEKIVKMRGTANALNTVGDMLGTTRDLANAAMAIEAGMAGTAAGFGELAAPFAIGAAAGAGQSMMNTYASYFNRKAEMTEAKNNLVYEFNDAQYAPDIVVGVQSSDLAVSHRILDVHLYNVFPKQDEAIRIDDFFSTYGYSIKEVKQPTITGRKHWNFLKTKGCVIGGDMPSTSRQAICDIIDGGIFFWKDGDELGNFRVEVTNGSINNPIV